MLVAMRVFFLGFCIFLGLLLVIDNYFVFATEKISVVTTLKELLELEDVCISDVFLFSLFALMIFWLDEKHLFA